MANHIIGNSANIRKGVQAWFRSIHSSFIVNMRCKYLFLVSASSSNSILWCVLLCKNLPLMSVRCIFFFVLCFVWLTYEIFLHVKVIIIFFPYFLPNILSFADHICRFILLRFDLICFTGEKDKTFSSQYFTQLSQHHLLTDLLTDLLVCCCLTNLPIYRGLCLNFTLCSISLLGYFCITTR